MAFYRRYAAVESGGDGITVSTVNLKPYTGFAILDFLAFQ